MSELAQKICEQIEHGEFAQALQLAKTSTSGRIHDGEVRQAVLSLTAELRSICMSLACRKMDGGAEYDAIESVLRQANELTGQDMYGRYVRQEPQSIDEASLWNAELDAVLQSVGIVDRSLYLRLMEAYRYDAASSVDWVATKMRVLLARVLQGKHLSVFDLTLGQPKLVSSEADLRAWIDESFPGLSV